MGNLSTTIPFTELVERLMTMGRVDSPNNEDYAKGIINDVYTRALPRLEDWNPIINDTGVLTMVPSYNTGTISVNAGSTSLTGSGTTFTSLMTAADGYKIKIAGNDNIYTFTYVSATSATISPALSGGSNISGASYTIFKDEYQLASDFDRFLKNGSIYIYTGGRIQDIIEEVPYDCFRADFRPEPNDNLERAIILRTHATTGYKIVRLNPPPKTAKVYPYDYIAKVTPLSEYTTGTIAVTNASTTVTGTDTAWSANVAAGDYFRVDNNGTGDSSKWYRVASVGGDTSITLDTAFGENTESGMDYTICKAPTAFPSEFHEFILYEALRIVAGESDDPNVQGFILQGQTILSDLKKNYKSRRTNAQFGISDDGYRGRR